MPQESRSRDRDTERSGTEMVKIFENKNLDGRVSECSEKIHGGRGCVPFRIVLDF